MTTEYNIAPQRRGFVVNPPERDEVTNEYISDLVCEAGGLTPVIDRSPDDPRLQDTLLTTASTSPNLGIGLSPSTDTPASIPRRGQSH